MADEMSDAVRQFILSEFLPDEDPAHLTDTTPLITGGILDSIATLRLVTFLEKRFGIAFQAHEVDAENLDTIADIHRIVAAKRS